MPHTSFESAPMNLRLLCGLFLLAGGVTAAPISAPLGQIAQKDVPSTPAGRKLAALLACVNQKDAARRTEFLKNGFADVDEYAERVAVSTQIHQQFAPLALVKVVESEAHKVVAHCSTSKDVVLQLELVVSPEGKHLITDIGMEPVQTAGETKLPPGMYPLINKDETTAVSARGVWRADGYGYIFDVKESSLTVYNVTKSFAWKQELDDDLFVVPEPDEGLDAKDHLIFTFHPLEPGYHMIRLKELPEMCGKTFDWTPTNLFDAYAEIFEQHYPKQFFKVRNVDWSQRFKDIRPTVNDKMSESKLFAAMAAMVKDLDDGHVGLSGRIDGKPQRARTGGKDTISRLRESFEPTEEVKTFNSYFRAWRERFKAGIRDEILRGNSKTVANNQIIWGRAHARVGYIKIFGMGGYTLGGTDSQTAELHKVLDVILTELADTEALIVDISFNGGGSDLFSTEIASHFTDKRVLGFSKWPDTRKQYRQARYVTPRTATDKNGVMYTKPIYLVTNDITASAAEIFTMCMRAMPHVTTVGIPTEGALSDILPKTLPNGWELGLTNEVYVDHEGACHEGPGVPPQIRMEIFDPKDIAKIGHAESIRKIVDMAIKRTKK